MLAKLDDDDVAQPTERGRKKFHPTMSCASVDSFHVFDEGKLEFNFAKAHRKFHDGSCA